MAGSEVTTEERAHQFVVFPFSTQCDTSRMKEQDPVAVPRTWARTYGIRSFATNILDMKPNKKDNSIR